MYIINIKKVYRLIIDFFKDSLSKTLYLKKNSTLSDLGTIFKNSPEVYTNPNRTTSHILRNNPGS